MTPRPCGRSVAGQGVPKLPGLARNPHTGGQQADLTAIGTFHVGHRSSSGSTGGLLMSSANLRMSRTSSSTSVRPNGRRSRGPSVSRAVIQSVGHRLALRRRRSLRGRDGRRRSGWRSDQAEAFQLGDLPADRGVVASDAVGEIDHADRPSRSITTSSGNSARSSDIPASRTIASSRCGRFMTLTMSINAPCKAREAASDICVFCTFFLDAMPSPPIMCILHIWRRR